jgi:transposase
MAKKYLVELNEEEMKQLNNLLTCGTQRVRKTTHARILLCANKGWADQQIQEALNVSIPTIERVRRRYVEQGLEGALSHRRPRRKYQRLLDGVQEAHLIALACQQPPRGYKRWSLRLLAREMVRLEYAEEVSHETIRQVLKDNELKPWLRKEWCIPPKGSADFVYYMENVPDLYQRPPNPHVPLVCFNETPQQLVRETRTPLPMIPGKPECYDYEYHREGTANLFMFFAPFLNWRHVKVTNRRTQRDWALCMRDLVDVHFPQAERILVIEDQLNTHDPACLYDVFEPAEARRILDRTEILSQETSAWKIDRNPSGATVDWRFTTADARIKLKKLYPSIHG